MKRFISHSFNENLNLFSVLCKVRLLFVTKDNYQYLFLEKKGKSRKWKPCVKGPEGLFVT